MPELTVISLGWGVQSFTLAAMAALGELPPVDAAIHADTTHERQATYQFAAKWTPWLEAHGIKVVTVRSPHTSAVRETDGVNVYIPAHTLSTRGVSSSAELTDGQLHRQCTDHWKIRPLREWVSAELVRRGLGKTPGVVELWLGISLDEFQRARTPDVAYFTYRYPLLEKRLTRADCIAWLAAHDLPVPTKSACVFCPYHNNGAWQELKRAGGADWQHALEIDTLIRDRRPPFPLFVHRRAVPLDQAVVIPEDAGYTQAGLFDRPEVEDAPCDNGGCFI